jgi:hypothetical protein
MKERKFLRCPLVAEVVIAMVSMFIVVGILSIGFAFGMVAAAVVDRRRSITVDSDASRFAPQAVDAPLPWSA